LSLYLDASVLLPTIVRDSHRDAVDAFFGDATEPLAISAFAAAEVASGLSRLVRTRALDAEDAAERLSEFDVWRATETTPVEVESTDVRAAAVIVRRFDLMLRTPDALHIAISRRLGAALVTLDRRLANAAGVLGLTVLVP
jgi:predicted nucleic acid-binding protein